MPIETAMRLIALCTQKNLRIATAESCTGGMIASLLTDIPGASAVFERGFIPYSNEAKTELLDVSPQLFEQHGAVSEAVVAAMVQGALVHSSADLAVAVSGIAGPGGGTDEKPVGLVFIGVGTRFGKPLVEEHVFPGRRGNVRLAAAEKALVMLHDSACQF